MTFLPITRIRHKKIFIEEVVLSPRNVSGSKKAGIHKTRYYIAIKMPNRSADTMVRAIVSALKKLPSEAVKSITCDRGTKFANWRFIEKQLNCDMFFADPYCAWQKGTNENLNGLLREFYPKGRNLSRVSPSTLKKNLALINARPKKVLGFIKSADLFDLCLKKCCT